MLWSKREVGDKERLGPGGVTVRSEVAPMPDDEEEALGRNFASIVSALCTATEVLSTPFLLFPSPGAPTNPLSSSIQFYLIGYHGGVREIQASSSD